MNLADLRKEYTAHGLRRADLHADPIDQFSHWFKAAVDAGVWEPNAMVLSTLGPDGYPASRVVLLKGLENRQFLFFTNYQSHKGQEIAANGNVALNFFWPQLERQIRISGICRKLNEAASENYFQGRPRASQIGAWVSNQSQVIADRQHLEDRFRALELQWSGRQVPRPPHWGGYSVDPRSLEFWQGRIGRLHDRFLYTRQSDESWEILRLAP
ncbi:MAG: pyridoxamine 5'-phosphate oxidase [Verrucomicrobia bacterium]|nr:pyridoxamine 5'-phosphate oxidase [Verrucomicrobiota bacterium]